MCATTIGRVLALDGDVAVVDLDGAHRRAQTLLLPDLRVGELVLVGLGTVLGRVTAEDAAALAALTTDHPSGPGALSAPEGGRR